MQSKRIGCRFWRSSVVAAVMLSACTATTSTTAPPATSPTSAPTSITESETNPATTTTEVAPAEVSPLFTAVDSPPMRADGPVFDVGAALAGGDDEWLLAGSVRNPEDRTAVPVVVTTAIDTTFISPTREELPLDRFEFGHVADLVMGTDGLVAVGSVRSTGERGSAVWTERDGEWSIDLLTATNGVLAVDSLSPDGTAAVGSVETDGDLRPTVWRNDGSSWVEVSVGDPVSPTDAHAIKSIAVHDDGLVGVGWIVDQLTGGARPGVWTESASGMSLIEPEGIESGGGFSDVLISDGLLIAAGYGVNGDFRVPLIATAESAEGPWTNVAPTVDTGSRSNSAGFGVGALALAGDALFAAMDVSFVQSVLRSDDDGASWNQVNNLVEALGNIGINAEGFAADRQGRILVVGGQTAALFDGTSWVTPTLDSIADRDTSPVWGDVKATADGFWAATTLQRPGPGGASSPRLALFSSTDGTTWDHIEAISFRGNEHAFPEIGVDANGPFIITEGTTTRDDPLTLWTPTENSWQTQEIAMPADVIRVFADDIATDGDISVVVGLEAGFFKDDGQFRLRPAAFRRIDPSTLEPATINSAVPADKNARFLCAAPGLDGFVGLVGWNTPQGYDTVSTQDGAEWATVSGAASLDEFAIEDCASTNDRLLAVGTDAEGLPVILETSDATTWQTSFLDAPGPAVPFAVSVVEGVPVVMGRATDPLTAITSGAIWYETDDGWQMLSSEFGTGLEPDGYASATSVWALAAHGDTVLVLGNDTDRVGLWRADLSEFLEVVR